MAEKCGATIRAMIGVEVGGDFLRRLEHHAEVHVVGRGMADDNTGYYLLRSLEFPASWDGRDAYPVVWEGDDGIDDWGVLRRKARNRLKGGLA